jgi:AcrR family transcriptional regulator
MAVPEPPWWRRRDPAPERQPLTREKIVDAALALLEREGMQGLSMRKLAQELGTGAASLYWHVGDKEQLLGLLLDRIVGESEFPEPDPARWREQVKELGRATRRLFAKHRDSAQLSLGRVPTGPKSLPAMENNLAVLAAGKIPARLVALAADMFALYVGAFAYEESLQTQRVDTEQLAAYFKSLPPEDFPVMTRLADQLVAGNADERFEFALELLVSGLEAMALRERRDHDGV